MRAVHPDLSEIHLIGPNTLERTVGPERCPALADLGIGFCGVSDAAAPYRMSRPRLVFGEVLATISGSGRVWVDGGWRVVGAGEAYVAPRGAAQAFQPCAGRRWRFAWVHYAERPGMARALPGEDVRVAPADPRGLRVAIEALADECSGAADPEVLGHLAAWVDLIARRIARGGRAPDERLRALWSRVETAPAREWSAAELAKGAGVGPEQLRRLCQATHGESPMARVTRLRMERAAALLRGTPLRVEAVAEQVGYGGVFAFSAAFKRHHGVSPSVWRRSERG